MKSLSESLLDKKVSMNIGPELRQSLQELDQNDWEDFTLTTEDGHTLIMGVDLEVPRYNRFISITPEETDRLHKIGIKTIKLQDSVGLGFLVRPKEPAFTIIGLDYNKVSLNGKYNSRNSLSGWNITASNIIIQAVGDLTMKDCTLRATRRNWNEVTIGKCSTVPKMERVNIEGFDTFSLICRDPVVRKYSDILGFKWPEDVSIPQGQDGSERTLSTSELQDLLGCTWDSKLKSVVMAGTDLTIEMDRRGTGWLARVESTNGRGLKIKPVK